MEEDINNTFSEEIRPSEKRVNERLEDIIKIANERNKYEAAHNPELNRALDTVKQFIIRKRRVCYGGTAMNAILPENKKFYNPEMDLPDYDFFTPDIASDIHDLVNDLQKGGFKDVYHRLGIHEGTSKILVNFVPIADITHISKSIYEIFLQRAIKRDGIYYTDPDILRMMMYLELSRPKGMVSRWEKVYERLQLINSVFPPKRRDKRNGTHKIKRSSKIQDEIWNRIYDFCIENQRVVITGDLDKYYTSVIKSSTPKFKLQGRSDIIGFLCADVKLDAKNLQNLLGGSEKCKLYLHNSRGEFVPEHVEVRYNKNPVAFLIKESACHSYLNFPLNDGRSIAVASLDTLITLYLSFAIFTKRIQELIPGIYDKIAQFVKLAEMNRRYKDPHVPSFPLSCRGYQKSYATLLRDKTKRLKKAREDIKIL
jgi:hypothetical protein